MKTDSNPNNVRQSEAAITTNGRVLDDYESQIVKLWNEGKSASDVARLLGKTRNAIMGKIWRLRNWGAKIEQHKRSNTRGLSAKSKRPYNARRSAPLLDILFKQVKSEKIKEVAVRQETIIAKSLNIRFSDLKNSSCRYVVNDGLPENFIFCGAPKERGSYCEAHALICYIPPKDVRSKQPFTIRKRV